MPAPLPPTRLSPPPPCRLEPALAALPAWAAALETRHTAQLSFAEIRKGAQALQQAYWRRKLSDGFALRGRGKQAAFAVAYAPLHFLLTAHIVVEHGLHGHPTLIDLGCGSGAAAAAWALCQPAPRPRVVGVDVSGWALGEARWNWAQLGLVGTTIHASMASDRWSVGRGAGIVCAFGLNELTADERERCVTRCLQAHQQHNASVLLIEPLAKGVAPFWAALTDRLQALGGVHKEHRLPVHLPPRLALWRKALSRAPLAMGARSLALAPKDQAP